MIAVAGGTGTLGTRLVPRLAGQGHAVRVLTRDPARARHLAGLDCVEMKCAAIIRVNSGEAFEAGFQRFFLSVVRVSIFSV